MEDNKSNNNECLPEKLLDDIYEQTQHKDIGGFMICYITKSGNVAISQRFNAPLVRLSLIKGFEQAMDQDVLLED
jgi:hypothetical protein